jgi:hypothetical protein
VGESFLVAVWKSVTFVVTLVLHALFGTALVWAFGAGVVLVALALVFTALRRSRPAP